MIKKRLFVKYFVFLVVVVSFWILTNGFNVSLNKQSVSGRVMILKESSIEDLEIDLNPNSYYYLKKYKTALKCNQKLSLPKWTEKSLMYSNRSDTLDYSTAASNSTHNERILRAVIIYFPIEKKNHFVNEFKVNSVNLMILNIYYQTKK
jgi:hypothetical protein